MTITYRLVNLDTNKVYESYKTAEFDYGTVFTADMLEGGIALYRLPACKRHSSL